MNKTFIFIIILVFLSSIYWFYDNGYLTYYLGDQNISKDIYQVPKQIFTGDDKTFTTGYSQLKYKIELVANNLHVPRSILFTSQNRILVNERDGKIREINNGKLNEESLYVVKDLVSTSESGLMGMVKDIEYEINKYIYICYSYEKSGTYNKVIRLIDRIESLEFDKIIIDGLPSASNHAGCELAFGPDEKLYVTIGDALDKSLSQDLENLNGKIIRLNKDGSIPLDNPFDDSYVWAYGLRNSQGLDWNSDGDMFTIDHGPSGFDGPPGGDEVNYIIKGGNYGWPIISHENSRKGMIDPLIVFTPAIAPGGLLVYQGDMFDHWKNDLFVGGLRGETIIHIILGKNNGVYKINSYEKMTNIDYGRIRKIVEGLDGSIYFSTSNEDGRGNKKKNGDKIFRLVKENN